jgi:hypothetical protein
MTIYEFADAINKNIVITRYSNQDNRFMAMFESSEIKSEGCLIGVYGNGKNAEEAIMNYANDIQGKVLVFNALYKSRQEFIVPYFS